MVEPDVYLYFFNDRKWNSNAQSILNKDEITSTGSLDSLDFQSEKGTHFVN